MIKSGGLAALLPKLGQEIPQAVAVGKLPAAPGDQQGPKIGQHLLNLSPIDLGSLAGQGDGAVEHQVFRRPWAVGQPPAELGNGSDREGRLQWPRGSRHGGRIEKECQSLVDGTDHWHGHSLIEIVPGVPAGLPQGFCADEAHARPGCGPEVALGNERARGGARRRIGRQWSRWDAPQPALQDVAAKDLAEDQGRSRLRARSHQTQQGSPLAVGRAEAQKTAPPGPARVIIQPGETGIPLVCQPHLERVPATGRGRRSPEGRPTLEYRIDEQAVSVQEKVFP